MIWYTYDTEVFKYDWIAVFKRMGEDEYHTFHNDREGLLEFLEEGVIYCGFNSKKYDIHILKAIVANLPNEEIKDISDWLIDGNQGWQHPDLRNVRLGITNVDIMDDMQIGQSLKSLEGHLGMSIEETEVDFNLDRQLTDEELALTVKYCTHDVEATEQIIKLRKSYLDNKIYLAKMRDIDPQKALTMTNAKLTAAYLLAEPKQFDDEREYVYPSQLERKYVPDSVFEFFDKLHDSSLPDETVFKQKLNLSIGSCPVVIGYGGIHGAIPRYREKSENGRIIRNFDVASYYPHLMTLFGYTSRAIPDAKVYSDMLERRMEAKKSGDKQTANALKLVANTTYGAMLNQYNALYDPLMGRSVCITGQLFLTELASHLIADCNDLKIVQLNTDGIMISFPESEYPKVLEITDEWQSRTGFELEEDKIREIIQKDVNNYIEIAEDGSTKEKGGYLVRGISTAGAFKVNNNATIIAKAIREYFVNDVPVSETINSCNNPKEFQIIAKAGASYSDTFQEVDGERVSVQRVNRIYASSDKRYGKINKVKVDEYDNESTAMIADLPEHCIIDNAGTIGISEIDKQFYIAQAIRKVNEFKETKAKKKGKRKMDETVAMEITPVVEVTDYSKMNIYRKLLTARLLFRENEIKKSGRNADIGFKYYELEDIVPIAMKVFDVVGLLTTVALNDKSAYMTVYNVDKPEECIVFDINLATYEGNRAVNPVQAMGATVTYYRRYLYMIVLDICESDQIDALPSQGITPPKAPAVPTVNHSGISLTGSGNPASELQIKQLKGKLKELREANPGNEEYIRQVLTNTRNFTSVTASDCEKYTNEVLQKLGGNA